MIKDRDLSSLKRLSSAQLDEFCVYWNSGPVRDGTEKKGKDQKVDSEPDYQKGKYRQYTLADGWTLYDHRDAEILLLCDEDGTVRLKGNAREIVGLLLNIVFTEQALKEIPSKEYGLVLSGGGAKGAFEIGVWRWLERTGLIHKITGISGTSVGALNSVLFSCVTLEDAEAIWHSIRQDDLTHVNMETIGRMTEFLLMTAAATATKTVRAQMIVKDLLPLLGETVFTQKKLEEIAERVLERKQPKERIVFSCLARESLQEQTEPAPELVLGTFHNADYYCLNNRTKKDIKRLVMASAALPLVYDPIKINNFQYRDGGCRDNTPYMPLVKSGFKKLIVVHLSERPKDQSTIDMAGNTILYHVYPTLRVKAVDTIKISKETTEDWINNGEQAATSQLGPFLRDGELILPDDVGKLLKKEKAMDKFDFEHFDYDKAFDLVQSEVEKPNILICGATGVGKSTLIRDMFQMSENEGPEIGDKGRSRTTGIHAYSPEGAAITLYDSQGYNIGADEQKFMRDVLGVISDKLKANPEEMSEHIHEVWYCVAAVSNRFFQADEKMIQEIKKRYALPVMVILTKVDVVDEDSIKYLKKAILEKIPDISIFTYASDEKTADWDEETKKQFVQKDEITEWALQHLDESLRAGFIPAMKKALTVKRNYIASKVIPKYAALAGGTVAATSFIHVPFTDSVPLMGLQLKMSYEIIKDYGIETEGQKIAANILGTSAVTYLGRTLATSLMKVIPLAGAFINAAVNTTVAVSVTAILGFAVTIVCEQYLAACVDNNGAENLPFSEYISAEKLKEALEYVSANQGQFGIQNITRIALENNSEARSEN